MDDGDTIYIDIPGVDLCGVQVGVIRDCCPEIQSISSDAIFREIASWLAVPPELAGGGVAPDAIVEAK